MITRPHPPKSYCAFSPLARTGKVAGGTGDIAFRAAQASGAAFSRQRFCDINTDRLEVGAHRAAASHPLDASRFVFVEAMPKSLALFPIAGFRRLTPQARSGSRSAADRILALKEALPRAATGHPRSCPGIFSPSTCPGSDRPLKRPFFFRSGVIPPLRRARPTATRVVSISRRIRIRKSSRTPFCRKIDRPPPGFFTRQMAEPLGPASWRWHLRAGVL